MRRGFLNMFPIDATGAAPQPRQIYDPGKTDNASNPETSNTQKKVNQSTTQEISVFSSFDGNKDNVGTYKEGASLFTRVDISQYADNYQVTKVDPNKDSNALSNIKKLANKSFDAKAAFDKIAQGWSTKLTETKITVEGSDDPAAQKNEISQKQKQAEIQLNNEFRTAAKSKEQEFNTNLMNQYNEALQKAENSYAKDNKAADGIKDDENESLKGQDGDTALNEKNNEVNARETDDKGNTKAGAKSYSQYDLNHDGTVTRAEIKGTSKGNNLVGYDGKVSIKPQEVKTHGGLQLDANTVAAKIAESLGVNDGADGITKKAGEYFEQLATNRININSGDFAVDLKGDKTISDDKIQKKLAAAIDKMDKKVEAQAKTLNKQINNEVYTKFSQMINSATIELQLNEAKEGDDPNKIKLKTQELPKEEPKANPKDGKPSGAAINVNGNAGVNGTRQFSISDSNTRASDAFGTGDDAWSNTLSSLFKGIGEAAGNDGAEGADNKNNGPDLSRCKNALQVAKAIVDKLGIEKPSTQGLETFATALVDRNPDVFNSKNGGTQPGVKLSNDTQLNLPGEREIKEFFKDRQVT